MNYTVIVPILLHSQEVGVLALRQTNEGFALPTTTGDDPAKTLSDKLRMSIVIEETSHRTHDGNTIIVTARPISESDLVNRAGAGHTCPHLVSVIGPEGMSADHKNILESWFDRMSQA